MSSKGMDPVAVADRLRKGEYVSLLEMIDGSGVPSLNNLEPRMLAERLKEAGRAAPPRNNSGVEKKDLLAKIPRGEFTSPDDHHESDPDLGHTVGVTIQPDSYLRLIWTGYTGSNDYVALYDHEPQNADDKDYLWGQWCYASNYKDGHYTTGTRLEDVGITYWAAYVERSISGYHIEAKQRLTIPSHDVSGFPDASEHSKIVLQWENSYLPSYYDYVALYDHEPQDDPYGYLSQQWCWALNHTNGRYMTDTNFKDIADSYWVAYISNLKGEYRIINKRRIDIPEHSIYLTEEYESDPLEPGKHALEVLNWTNPQHATYYDYIALFNGEPKDWNGYLWEQWCWALNHTNGSYQTGTRFDPNNPTKYWLAYVSSKSGKYQIVGSKQQNYEPNWMASLAGWIRGRKLREVVLPGSHDAGSCGITIDSPSTPDAPAIVRNSPTFLVKPWAVTQQLSIKAQLEAGVRYIDVRTYYLPERNDFYSCHSLQGVSLDNMLDSVARFVSSSTQELILLDFNHFYTPPDLNTMSPALHQRLAEKIQAYLGDRMLDSAVGVDVTVQNIWDLRKNVIVFYHDSDIVAKNPLFWAGSNMESPWPDARNTIDLKNYLEINVIGKLHPAFWVLQGVISPNWPDIVRRIIVEGSLMKVASDLNPQVMSWVKAWSSRPVAFNVIMLDFTNMSSLMPVVIEMNRSQAGEIVGRPVNKLAA